MGATAVQLHRHKNEKNIARENGQNSERSGRMTEDGDSLAVYTRVVN